MNWKLKLIASAIISLPGSASAWVACQPICDAVCMAPSFLSGSASYVTAVATGSANVAKATASAVEAIAAVTTAQVNYKVNTTSASTKIELLVWGSGTLPTSTNALEVKAIDGINVAFNAAESNRVKANEFTSMDMINHAKQLIKTNYRITSNKISSDNTVSLSASKDNLVQFYYELKSSMEDLKELYETNSYQIPIYQQTIDAEENGKSEEYNNFKIEANSEIANYILDPQSDFDLWKQVPFVSDSPLSLANNLVDLQKTNVEESPAFNAQDTTYINLGKKIELYLGLLEQQNENNYLNLIETRLHEKCEVPE